LKALQKAINSEKKAPIELRESKKYWVDINRTTITKVRFRIINPKRAETSLENFNKVLLL
jgi:hypothetical protein